MLKRGRDKLPKVVFERERFEIPKVSGHIQGNKTVINNFSQIAQYLHRDVIHLQKYLSRELAAPGNLTSTALILNTKIPAARINEKIRQYANEFVLCSDCGKPDTVLEKDKTLTFIKCTACGAKHHVKTKI